MQMVDEDGIVELIGLTQAGTDGGTANSESILSELKPFIKHHEPKPVLAGLKVGSRPPPLGTLSPTFFLDPSAIVKMTLACLHVFLFFLDSEAFTLLSDT